MPKSNEVEEDEDEGGAPKIPLVPWRYDTANLAAMSGVLLIPRVSNFRVAVGAFRKVIDAVDLTHGTKLLELVPHAIADDEAFQRTAQHFRYGSGTLLKVPMPANRNPRYTWAESVLDHSTEMVSMRPQAWLEFVRDSKDKHTGTVGYSTAASGYPMPADVAQEFTDSFNRNCLTFGTADCRTIVAAILGRLAAKLIGRNIWFIPAVDKDLLVFQDVLNAINELAEYTALVAFEIMKTPQNDTVAKGVITEVFARQMKEAQTAVDEYMADLAAYNADPVNNRMRYKARATRGINEINLLVKEAELYASVMGLVGEDAIKKAATLQRQWETLFATTLVRDGKFVEADLIVGLSTSFVPALPKDGDENA